MKIDFAFWALAWILYMGWNAINDPLIGALGDRTQSRHGRRIPWLRVATPLIGLSLVFLFFPPLNLDPNLQSSQWIYFSWLFAGLMLYDLFYTIVGISENSLVAELTIDPVERANTNFFWSLGIGLGSAATFVIPFLFIQDNETIPYEINQPIIQTIIIIFAILGSVFLAIMAFGVKERRFIQAKKPQMGLVESIKYTLRNRGFIMYAGLFFCITFFYTITNSQISFFVQDVLKVDKNDILGYLPIIAFIGSSLIGFPVGMALNMRFGGKRSLIYLFIIVISGLFMLVFSFDIILAIIALFIVGFGYAGINLIFPTLMADVIDKDELETGWRREGAYFGSAAFFTKPAQSIAQGMIALVFFVTNYDQDATVQSLPAQIGVVLTISVIPAIFLMLGLIFIKKFPIDSSTEEYKVMKKKVEQLHDEKLAQLKKELDSKTTGTNHKDDSLEK